MLREPPETGETKFIEPLVVGVGLAWLAVVLGIGLGRASGLLGVFGIGFMIATPFVVVVAAGAVAVHAVRLFIRGNRGRTAALAAAWIVVGAGFGKFGGDMIGSV